MVGPKLMQTSQHLREHAALLAASSTHTQAPIAAWKVHDYCNLVTLPVVVVLTGLSLTSPRWARPLALYFLVYIAADAIWICAQPEIVRAPAVLLSHHAATALLLVHALTHAAHRKYVAWLSCVELNTFFLILRRHIRRPSWAVAIVQRSFAISWLLIRVCLFPVVVMVLWTLPPNDWPSSAHRFVVVATTTALALLQLAWTRGALNSFLARAQSPGSSDRGRVPAPNQQHSFL